MWNGISLKLSHSCFPTILCICWTNKILWKIPLRLASEGHPNHAREKKISVILAFEFSQPLLTRSTRANNIIKDMIRINTLIYYLLTFICVFKMIMKIKLNFVAVWWEEKSIILLIILWSGSILIKRFVAPVWQQVPVFFELSL